MNVHTISKGVVLYLALVFVAMSILIFNGFLMTERTFTLFLIIGMVMISFYTGKSSEIYASLNGFLLGLLTSIALIFFVSSYTDMNWELNFMILVCWTGIATAGSYVGGRFRKISEKLVATPQEQE